jgi:uncharacterized repeat protein (TIGR02543 family)/uncharacterized protein (TIGR02145 family)
MLKRIFNLGNVIAIAICLAVTTMFSGCEKEPDLVFYTVTFNSQGGSEVSSQTVEEGGKVTKPTDPTREDYTFVAWYKEMAATNEWNFATDVVTASITLFAKWHENEIGVPPIVVDNDESLEQEVFADEEQGSSGVTFTTTAAWISSILIVETAMRTTASNWISISPENGGAGTHTVEITLEPNFTGEDRTAVITISSGGTGIEITVTQKGVKEDGNPLLPLKGVNLHGVIWALSNVGEFGQFVETPQDFGKFYQWNNPVPITEIDYSYTTSVTEWEKTNDPCPEGWRVPTEIEFYSLFTVNSTWTENYNGTSLAGRIFGTEPNIVFLPAAGIINGGAGMQGQYWVSTSWIHYPSGQLVTPNFAFYSGGGLSLSRNSLPTNGFTVRCVAVESEYIPTPFITQNNPVNGTVIQGNTHTLWIDNAFAHGCAPDIITYQWQQSRDAINWVNAEGESTNASYTTLALIENTYFRRQASDACGNTIVSESALVTVVIFPTDVGEVVINGIRWATRNVDMPGTFASNPENAGMFYQWNRRIGWSSTEPLINSNGDAHWDNSASTGTVWYSQNDPCPTGWRVPTEQELQSLINAGSVWTRLNDVNGRLFGTAPNLIFLPAVGYRNFGWGVLINNVNAYWSSTPGIFTEAAWNLQIGSGHAGMNGVNWSNNGFSVRCVAE